jgi:hypothetical protein
VKFSRFDFDNKTFEFSGIVPELILTGQYSLDGKVMLLPVQGEGDITTTISKCSLSVLVLVVKNLFQKMWKLAVQ